MYQPGYSYLSLTILPKPSAMASFSVISRKRSARTLVTYKKIRAASRGINMDDFHFTLKFSSSALYLYPVCLQFSIEPGDQVSRTQRMSPTWYFAFDVFFKSLQAEHTVWVSSTQ